MNTQKAVSSSETRVASRRKLNTRILALQMNFNFERMTLPLVFFCGGSQHLSSGASNRSFLLRARNRQRIFRMYMHGEYRGYMRAPSKSATHINWNGRISVTASSAFEFRPLKLNKELLYRRLSANGSLKP
jgi:hypothetical protein